ncbi:hypothetical protein [Parahaliea mediterranea]|uniref:hypothetical protein n=1 Tax=Parahaliea mediterranea TaxID=651086 RepID=UPI000E2ED961|nr:hypothetical protein [Parahaliea mediterranea]
MNDLLLMRALHVLGVVIWIGGVFMATTVILPAVRRGQLGDDKLAAFHVIEHRFVWIARAAVLVVGISGFYLIIRMQLWPRFGDGDFWWMHAMVSIWLLFVFVLFVGEPLLLRRHFPRLAAYDPDLAFAILHWVHLFLLALSLVTVLGAAAGAHGWRFLTH